MTLWCACVRARVCVPRYEDLAVSLALDMDKLLAIRRRLEMGRVT
jgi:hypothetical protein